MKHRNKNKYTNVIFTGNPAQLQPIIKDMNIPQLIIIDETPPIISEELRAALKYIKGVK